MVSLYNLSTFPKSLSSLFSRSFSSQNHVVISPYLLKYKWPITALSSGAFRLSGLGLYGGIYGMGILSLVKQGNLDCIDSFISLYPSLLPYAKLLFAYPITYHFFGGIRHLYWDMAGKMLSNSEARMSSYVLIFGTFILALFFSFYEKNDI